MWWQVLPSGFILAGALYAPQMINYACNCIFLGNPYLRTINKKYEGHMFLRDYRLTGNVYKQNGLDCFTPVQEPEYIEECVPVRRLKEPVKNPDDDD